MEGEYRRRGFTPASPGPNWDFADRVEATLSHLSRSPCKALLFAPSMQFCLVPAGSGSSKHSASLRVLP